MAGILRLASPKGLRRLRRGFKIPGLAFSIPGQLCSSLRRRCSDFVGKAEGPRKNCGSSALCHSVSGFKACLRVMRRQVNNAEERATRDQRKRILPVSPSLTCRRLFQIRNGSTVLPIRINPLGQASREADPWLASTFNSACSPCFNRYNGCACRV